MSISSVGSPGAANLSALLAALQARMQNSMQTQSSSVPDGSAGVSPSQPAGGSSQLTGSATATISSQILDMLIGLQQQASGASTQTATASQDAASGTDPAEQLFSATDTDGDGTVSQNEMEKFIEGLGGTQSQADALYASLDQNGSGTLNETQLASAAQPMHHGRHHHHMGGAGGAAQAQILGDQLAQAVDTNSDGTVSSAEFDSFVTQNGGASDQASADFAALDTGNSGSLQASDFTTAIENLQSNAGSGAYSPTMMLLNAFAQNGSTASSTASIIA